MEQDSELNLSMSDSVTAFLAISCLSLSAVSLTGNAEAANTVTTTVEVNIVSTLNLVAQNGIVFGDVSSSAIPGTVTIGTDSSRTATGGATISSNSPATPAQYEVSGYPNAFYNITLPDSVILTSAAGDTMVVEKFSSIPNVSGQLDASGRQNMNIGATLNVGSFQPFGAYRGIMATTVDYD